MPSLKALVKAAELPITVRHERWLTENSNPKYTDAALKFAQDELSGVVGGQRRRERLFRASGVGQCERQRIFKRMGLPESASKSGKLPNIFHTGQFLHLKWQMAGLTDGWLKEPEVIVDRKDLGVGGTMDGILVDDSGFEFKSINSRGYSGVMTYGPKTDHIRQVNTYMWLTGIETFSVVYEDKNTGEWAEFRVNRDEHLIESIATELITLQEVYAAKKLPKMLSACEFEEGATFRNCPFSSICPGATEEIYR